MAEVLAALDQIEKGGALGAVPPPPPAMATPGTGKKGPPLPLLIGGGVAAAAVIAGGLYFVMRPKPAPAPAEGGSPVVASDSGAPAAGGVRPSEQVRRAVEAALPAVACSWLDIVQVSETGGAVSLRLTGVAGSPVEAQQAVREAATATGANISLVDTSNVFPVGQPSCAPLDTFRTFRVPTSEQGRKFASAQSNWELMQTNDPCVGPNAKAIVDIKPGDPSRDFSILGMDGAARLQQIFRERAHVEEFRAALPQLITKTGEDEYRATVCYDETALVGMLMVTGQGPFSVNLPQADQSPIGRNVDAAWLSNFGQQARAKNWRTEMVWYRIVDDTPG
jgi:hypothetical protein